MEQSSNEDNREEQQHVDNVPRGGVFLFGPPISQRDTMSPQYESAEEGNLSNEAQMQITLGLNPTPRQNVQDENLERRAALVEEEVETARRPRRRRPRSRSVSHGESADEAMEYRSRPKRPRKPNMPVRKSVRIAVQKETAKSKATLATPAAQTKAAPVRRRRGRSRKRASTTKKQEAKKPAAKTKRSRSRRSRSRKTKA